MALRTTVLRSMLCFLILAAVGGVGSLFIPTSFGVRMVFTSAIIAVASALFIPVLPKREGYAVLLSGRVWMTIVTLIALGGIALAWNDLIGRPFDEEVIIISQTLLFLGMFAAIIPLKLLEHSAVRLRSVALGSVLFTGGSTLVIIGALFSSNLSGGISSNFRGNLFGEWAVLVLGGIAAAACFAGWVAGAKGLRGILPIAGIVATVICAAFWQPIVLDATINQAVPAAFSYPLLSTGISVGLALYSLGTALALGRIERRLLPVIALLAMVMGGIASAMTTAPKTTQWLSIDQLGRMLAAVSIVEGCLALAVVVLWQLGRRASRPWVITGAEITCPRCGKRSTFETGESPCKTCGFRVLIAFRDANCARCQHDVRTLEMGHPCPECGLDVERSCESYLATGATGVTGATGAAGVALSD